MEVESGTQECEGGVWDTRMWRWGLGHKNVEVKSGTQECEGGVWDTRMLYYIH